MILKILGFQIPHLGSENTSSLATLPLSLPQGTRRVFVKGLKKKPNVAEKLQKPKLETQPLPISPKHDEGRKRFNPQRANSSTSGIIGGSWGENCSRELGFVKLLSMEEILNNHLRCIRPVNNSIHRQPQLLQDFSHQQKYDFEEEYVVETWRKASKQVSRLLTLLKM